MSALLLSDANVLIDLGIVGGLRLLPLLGNCEVLSTVLLECQHASQPNLLDEISAVGIATVEVEWDLIEAAEAYSNALLSLQDRQCLLYARNRGRMVLTCDQNLRYAAQGIGVACHDSVWLVEQALATDAFTQTELCGWLNVWPLRRRRLPKDELQRLRALIGCAIS